MILKRIEITLEEYEAAKRAEKTTQDKRISKKLKIIMLRYEGLSNDEIGKVVGLCGRQVSRLVTEFKRMDINEYSRKRYGGNHRLLSEKQEDEILSKFVDTANSGQIVTAKEIKAALDQVIGKDTDSSYVYRVLKRHSWRKIMPRSKHPKRASDEEIADSKKLTLT